MFSRSHTAGSSQASGWDVTAGWNAPVSWPAGFRLHRRHERRGDHFGSFVAIPAIPFATDDQPNETTSKSADFDTLRLDVYDPRQPADEHKRPAPMARASWY
ncbi:hypothetical protein Hesp01_65040 [Herbidospora sp. NBRC 101105]|nr:hypothetical protein Hesp01_65040 [Herbidospora sp. NBRC 101105]